MGQDKYNKTKKKNSQQAKAAIKNYRYKGNNDWNESIKYI